VPPLSLTLALHLPLPLILMLALHLSLKPATCDVRGGWAERSNILTLNVFTL